MKTSKKQKELILFKEELELRIKTYGYWSNEVYTLNNLIQKIYGYTKWFKLHNEVKARI